MRATDTHDRGSVVGVVVMIWAWVSFLSCWKVMMIEFACFFCGQYVVALVP